MPRPYDPPCAPRRGTRSLWWALAAPVAATLLVAGCSGSTKHASPARKTTTTTVGKGNVALRVSVAGVESAGQPAAVPDAAKNAISQSVNTYVQSATVHPMQSGRPAGDIAALFTAGAAARLATDLPAFIDSGLPAATGPVAAKTATVVLTGLAQQDGAVVLVDAGLTLDVAARTKGGPESVQRTADLVFANDGGTWKIASYDVRVTRTVPGDEPSTTTAVSAK
jgi:hypothetical protein